jgi:hypothetical protein
VHSDRQTPCDRRNKQYCVMTLALNHSSRVPNVKWASSLTVTAETSPEHRSSHFAVKLKMFPRCADVNLHIERSHRHQPAHHPNEPTRCHCKKGQKLVHIRIDLGTDLGTEWLTQINKKTYKNSSEMVINSVLVKQVSTQRNADILIAIVSSMAGLRGGKIHW